GRNLGDGAEVAAAYRTVDLVTGVKDLNGNEDNTFGMKFNGYLETADWETNATAVKAVDAEGLALAHYKSQPVVYTVTDPEAKVTVTVDDPKNAAVKVVRIK